MHSHVARTAPQALREIAKCSMSIYVYMFMTLQVFLRVLYSITASLLV